MFSWSPYNTSPYSSCSPVRRPACTAADELADYINNMPYEAVMPMILIA